MEEEMIRALSAGLLFGSFMFSILNPVLAGGGTAGLDTDPQHRSLLSTWDKPVFAPERYQDKVPWLNSRSAPKGPKIDFLFNPKVIDQPLVAQSAPSTGSELGNIRSNIGVSSEHLR